MKTNLITLLIISLCTLYGCSSEKYEVVTAPLIVEKPVKPKLDISTLKSNSKSSSIIKSYVISLNQCIDYATQQEELLGAIND